MAFQQLTPELPGGEAQRSLETVLPVCPLCGGKHDYETETTEGFSTLYRFRCRRCGAILTTDSTSRDPFRDPFLLLTVETCGRALPQGLLEGSAYPVRVLVEHASRAQAAEEAPAKQDTLGRPAEPERSQSPERRPDFSLNDLIGAPPERQTEIEKAARAAQEEERHAAKHTEEAGTCQNDHVYGEEENKKHRKKNMRREAFVTGLICFIVLFGIVLIAVFMQ